MIIKLRKTVLFAVVVFAAFCLQQLSGQCIPSKLAANAGNPYQSKSVDPDWDVEHSNNVAAGDCILYKVNNGSVYRWTTNGDEDYATGIGTKCLTNAQCSAPAVCSGRQDKCAEANECSTGSCVDNKCKCTLSDDCSIGKCIGGSCGCVSDNDCAAGYYCSDGFCSTQRCSLFDTEVSLFKGGCTATGKCPGTNDVCLKDSDCKSIKCIGGKCNGSGKTCSLPAECQVCDNNNYLTYNDNAININQSQLEFKSDFDGTVGLLITE
ncbi:MAG TPA: hypothetical protein PLZ43_15755, partial [bacterium]|nr:hypothetical protein [bacterium]